MQKKCLLCGDTFEANSPRQKYCNKEITVKCIVCGKSITTTCNQKQQTTCSSACAGKASTKKLFTCTICGEQFYPSSSRQKYCKKPIKMICEVCGKSYMSFCGDIARKTCGNDECRKQYAHKMSTNHYLSTDRECAICGKLFHPVNNTQKYCKTMHEMTCVVCGKEFITDTSKQDFAKTCSPECKYKLAQMSITEESRKLSTKKARETYMKRTGYSCPAKNPEVIKKMYATYYERTGYIHPSHNIDVRSKSAKTLNKQSNLESRVVSLFNEYNIECKTHYVIADSSNTISHEFDIYIPKYKCLIDCDGVYFHSYLCDQNGKQVLDYYDEDRISLVPQDHMFYVIVEGNEDRCVKEIVNILKSMDSDIFDYDGYLFNWCRSIEFPYPSYSDKRLRKDYNSLCGYNSSVYKPSARLGDSIIQQFHHSIYDAHVGKYPSPKEAWYNDALLKRVILNRLIYKNDVDPSKILRGFNISKICPRVSVFNPVLAKHIVTEYLNEFSEIFDPFSGFSGRLLGVASCNKMYIGHDKNSVAVDESNHIIDFLNLKDCSISEVDILNDSGVYECLMTCPPYNTKEIYSNESEFKSCDDWIDEILSRYQCRRYAFVVDMTEKYKDYVVEQIKSTSHFCKTVEYLIVI